MMKITDQTRSRKQLLQKRENMNGGNFFPRLKFLYVFFVFAYFVAHASVSTNAQHITINNAADGEISAQCTQELQNADLDGDGSVNATEFLVLIGGYSGGFNHSSFEELDIRLILLYHYTACSCMNRPGENYDCCYGSNSAIDFNTTNSTGPNPEIIEFCDDIELLINEIYSSIIPSSFPTILTSSPTPAPETPTSAPTASPTITPGTPTSAPTASSTIAPGPPTSAPTASPTIAPGSPTSAPTASPTTAPGPPTSAPTSSPTTAPGSPTSAPTASPTTAPGPPTNPPTSSDGCYPISYYFNLENDLGLDAYKIDNAINNTLKADLINATKYSVIETLNTTYPRLGSAQAAESSEITNIFIVKRFLDYVYHEKHDMIPLDQIPEDQGGRKLRALHSRRIEERGDSIQNSVRLQNEYQSQRRLVYFTDEIPITIVYIADNPFCSKDRPLNCVVMEFNICIILEQSDDYLQIRQDVIKDLPTGIPKYLLGY